MAKSSEGHDRQDREDRKHKHKKKHKPPKKKPPGQPGAQTTPDQFVELSQTSMPADQQAGLNPQDYPNYAATFSTGPAEAVQYHYSRQDLFNEQYAAEQIAAEQQQATTGARAVPGPGQMSVAFGGMANNPT
jgi:hypothetical protein